MNSAFYNIYFYKFKSNTELNNIVPDFSSLSPRIQVSVQDVSNLSPQERVRIIGGMVNAERLRMYEEGKQMPCYIHVVKYSPDRYFYLVSMYPFNELYQQSDKIFQMLCNTTSISYITSGNNRDTCAQYWSRYIRGLPDNNAYDCEEQFQLDGDEFFPIEIDEINELKQLFIEHPLQGKALLTRAFARVAAAGARTSSVTLEDYLGSCKLTRIPLRITEQDNEMSIENIVAVFSSANRNNNITYEEFSSLCDFDFEKSILYAQSVVYDGMYDSFFKESRLNELYQFDAIDYPNVPLMLVFHMNGGMAGLQLIYDSAYFHKIPIEGLHNAFCVTLSKLMKRDYTGINYKPFFQKLSSNEEKRLELIASCLKKSGWFDAYAETDLIRFAKKCLLKRIFFGQNFIDSKTTMDSVYLLILGKVEVVCRDRDNVLHSLRLIKEMNFFALESLSDKSISKEDYQALTDEVVAIAIKREDFLEEAQNHNSLFVKTISQQTALLQKYEQLWIMS